MSVDAHTVLAGLELALFVILLVPTAANSVALVRNGQTGWLFLLLFIMVKIVAAAMLISINTQSTPASIGIQVAAQVLYSVALGPLLAATLSFVNNSVPKKDSQRGGSTNRRGGLFGLLGGDRSRRLRLAHILILAGLALGIVGGVDRAPKSSTGQVDPTNYDKGATLLKVSVFLFLAGLLATAWGLFSCWKERSGLDKAVRVNMIAAALSLPLILLRLIYSFLADFNLDTTTSTGHSTTFNIFAGSWVAYLLMVLLPQVGVVTMYNVAGFLGRKSSRHTPLKQSETFNSV